MHEQLIPKYLFNNPSSIGIEVKPLTFLWEKAEMTQRAHRADFYQLIWLREGTLSLMLDFIEVELSSRQVLLISPDQVVRFLPGAQPEAFAVLFVPEFLGEAPSDTRLLHLLLSASLRGYKAITLEELPIAGLMQQLTLELAGETSMYQLIIARSCLRILLSELARRLPSEASQGGELAGRFFEAVEEQYHHLYNVQDYILRLSVPEKLLSHAVRQAVGMTPKAYLDQRRLLQIKRLLAYSDLSVKEIAFALGFDEPTNFNKFFRKHTATTPLLFRQAQQ